jgi:hypothetical protein
MRRIEAPDKDEFMQRLTEYSNRKNFSVAEYKELLKDFIKICRKMHITIHQREIGEHNAQDVTMSIIKEQANAEDFNIYLANITGGYPYPIHDSEQNPERKRRLSFGDILPIGFEEDATRLVKYIVQTEEVPKYVFESLQFSLRQHLFWYSCCLAWDMIRLFEEGKVEEKWVRDTRCFFCSVTKENPESEYKGMNTTKFMLECEKLSLENKKDT